MYISRSIAHRGSLREEIQEFPVGREQVYDDGVIQEVVFALLVLLRLREVHPVGFGGLGDLVLGARKVLDAARQARQRWWRKRGVEQSGSRCIGISD